MDDRLRIREHRHLQSKDLIHGRFQIAFPQAARIGASGIQKHSVAGADKVVRHCSAFVVNALIACHIVLAARAYHKPLKNVFAVKMGVFPQTAVVFLVFDFQNGLNRIKQFLLNDRLMSVGDNDPF